MTTILAARADNTDTAITIRYAIGRSIHGHILVACSAEGVCAVLPGDDAVTLIADLAGRFAGMTIAEDPAGMAQTLQTVIRYIDAPGGPGNDVDLPLDMGGTAFQRRVWRVLRSIPAGQTASYAAIAAAIGAPKAARAVAQACAANRLAVLVPCHRVVRTDGGLSGYRWGLTRKRALLAREAAR